MLGPHLDSRRRAAATFPVKPCGLPGRPVDGNLPHLWGPFPSGAQVLVGDGSPSLPREAS